MSTALLNGGIDSTGSQDYTGLQRVPLAAGYLPADTNTHSPATDASILGFADLRQWSGAQVWIASTLNQIVDVQIAGAFRRSADAAAGDQSLTNGKLMLPAWSSGAPLVYSIHVGPGASNWAAWIYPIITAETAATAGGLSITVVKFGFQCVPLEILAQA